MARMIAARVSGEKIFLAFMKKNKVACVTDAFVKRNDSQLFYVNEKSRIGISHGFGMAMTIPDDRCITKIINLLKPADAEKVNIENEFNGLIDKAEMSEYLYDYQFLPSGKTGERIICVAVKKDVVDDLRKEARNAGAVLEYAVPESIALGNLLKKYDNHGGSIFIDMGIKTTVVRVFKSFECIASYEIENGIESIVDLLENSGIHLLDKLTNTHREIYRSKGALAIINKLLNDIIRTVDYYDEKGISNRSMDIYYTGEGVFIPELVNSLRKNTGHKCESAAKLLDGEISVREASLLAAAIGATF